MNLNREPIKKWFGFTRRERRSTFILLLIIVLIIGLRYAIPDSRITIEDITETVSAMENHPDLSSKKEVPTEKPVIHGYGSGKKSGKSTFTGKYIPQKTKIDINTSDSATLVRLPGIGPVLSARIIKYRRLLGGFARIDQLKEVYGLKTETYEIIRERVFADSSVIKRIDINSAGYKELSHIHYLEKYEISAILKYRELKGKIRGIGDLTENKLITKDKARKINPYLNFE